MVDINLVIDEEFAKLLPVLTEEEHADLERNLVSDGRCINALLYWHDEENDKNLIVDGMNRWPICTRLGIPYRTEPMPFESRQEAKLWILDHYLGMRHSLNATAIRQLRGTLYNELKAMGQNVHSGKRNAARDVAARAGVDERTVRRDGAYVAALEDLPKSLREAIRSGRISATDEQVKALAKADPDAAARVARDVRTGWELDIGKSMAVHGIRTPQPSGKKKTRRQRAPTTAETAKGQLKIWADTVGRWLGTSPSIDDYRKQWPGEEGDRVLRAAKELYQALKTWRIVS